MTYNTAVMAARRRTPPHDLNYFPTPPWATRALFEVIGDDLGTLSRQVAWEPACGEGHMSRVLKEYFSHVIESDVFNYGIGADLYDFLGDGWLQDVPAGLVDWVITNPPFSVAEDFIQKGLDRAGVGVAMFVRLQFMESQRRYHFFKGHPPSCIALFSGRVNIAMGRLDKNANQATAYCWMIWHKDGPQNGGTTFTWISDCARKRLEKPADYPASQGGIL